MKWDESRVTTYCLYKRDAAHYKRDAAIKLKLQKMNVIH